jgi:hypothetical protein
MNFLEEPISTCLTPSMLLLALVVAGALAPTIIPYSLRRILAETAEMPPTTQDKDHKHAY